MTSVGTEPVQDTNVPGIDQRPLQNNWPALQVNYV